MGVLMLKCPQTGRESSTGLHLEEDSFKRLPDTVTKAACPHCGQLHSWWTRDARLSDGDRANATRRHASSSSNRTRVTYLVGSREDAEQDLLRPRVGMTKPVADAPAC
jgi:hypothetical protein